jgi:hypothetical protein
VVRQFREDGSRDNCDPNRIVIVGTMGVGFDSTSCQRRETIARGTIDASRIVVERDNGDPVRIAIVR